MTRGFFISIILLATAAPAPVYAGVVITEIMYDLEVADTEREWIEIQNTGSSQVDLTGWKLFEANTNHGITASLPQTLILQSGAYAIIADNTEKFLLDQPSFSGTLFGSSFSLSNTGEALVLRNADLVDSDAVTYSSDWGAAGDGKSLQKTSSGWVAASPTPGFGSVSNPVASSGGDTSGAGAGAQVEMSESVSKIKVSAGADRTVLAGAEVIFEGSAEGFVDVTADKIRFHWNFGDGKTGEGNKVAHTFSFPGVYEVLLTASFAGASASDSAKITATENPVVVSEIKLNGFLEIHNNSARKIDFSNFGIGANDSKPFYFPEGTFLSPWSYLAIEPGLLGFKIPQSGTVKILYPNGKVLFSSFYPASALGEKESLSLTNNEWAKSKATPGAKNETLKNLTAPRKSGQSTAAQLAVEQPAKAAKKETTEINLASVSSAGSYIRLFLGLGIGVLGGLAFFFAKRYLA